MFLVYCPKCGHKNLPNTLDSCPECGFSISAYFGNLDNDWNVKDENDTQQEDSIDLTITEKSEIDLQQEKDILLEKEHKDYQIKNKERQLREEIRTKTIATILSIIGIIAFIISWSLSSHGSLSLLIVISFSITVFCIAGLIMSSGSIRQMQKEINLMKSDYQEWERQIQKRNQREIELYMLKEATAPRCPHCNSTNIKPISTLNRSISVQLFGLASSKIGKQFECKNCKYKW